MFWGDSVESKRIFQLQTRIIRIMTGSTLRISCRTLFKNHKYWLWPPNTYFPWWGSSHQIWRYTNLIPHYTIQIHGAN